MDHTPPVARANQGVGATHSGQPLPNASLPSIDDRQVAASISVAHTTDNIADSSASSAENLVVQGPATNECVTTNQPPPAELSAATGHLEAECEPTTNPDGRRHVENEPTALPMDGPLQKPTSLVHPPVGTFSAVLSSALDRIKALVEFVFGGVALNDNERPVERVGRIEETVLQQRNDDKLLFARIQQLETIKKYLLEFEEKFSGKNETNGRSWREIVEHVKQIEEYAVDNLNDARAKPLVDRIKNAEEIMKEFIKERMY